MSQALKCYRCKTCYDPTSGGDTEYVAFSNPVFMSANSRKLDKRTRWLDNENGAMEQIDLCPSCTRAFEKFMKCETFYQSVVKPSFTLADIYFDTYDDARDVLYKLRERVQVYGEASVCELYDLSDLRSPNGYKDFKYGWRDLTEAKVVPCLSGKWTIQFPEQVSLETDKKQTSTEYELNGGDTDGDSI